VLGLYGFATRGAFSTFVHFDMPNYFVVFFVLVDAAARKRSRAKASASQPVIQTPMKGARQ
jgi:hypothetical protein